VSVLLRGRHTLGMEGIGLLRRLLAALSFAIWKAAALFLRGQGLQSLLGGEPLRADGF